MTVTSGSFGIHFGVIFGSFYSHLNDYGLKYAHHLSPIRVVDCVALARVYVCSKVSQKMGPKKSDKPLVLKSFIFLC